MSRCLFGGVRRVRETSVLRAPTADAVFDEARSRERARESVDETATTRGARATRPAATGSAQKLRINTQNERTVLEGRSQWGQCSNNAVNVARSLHPRSGFLQLFTVSSVVISDR